MDLSPDWSLVLTRVIQVCFKVHSNNKHTKYSQTRCTNQRWTYNDEGQCHVREIVDDVNDERYYDLD